MTKNDIKLIEMLIRHNFNLTPELSMVDSIALVKQEIDDIRYDNAYLRGKLEILLKKEDTE